MYATHISTATDRIEQSNAVAFSAAKNLITQRQDYVRTDQPETWANDTSRPYGQLAEWTKTKFSSLSENVRSSHSAYITKQSINQKFMLWANQWHLYLLNEHVATCRMVLIQGSKNEIINTWIFPTNPLLNPVFAAELIATAGAPRLSFIDIQTPALETNVEAIRSKAFALRKAHATILCDEEPPSWAVTDSQGGYVFSRQLSEAAFPEIQACYKDYLTTSLACIQTETKEQLKLIPTELRSSQEQLREYQNHHMESSPGNTFLSKLFGDEWTNSFLKNFLFTLA